MFLCVYVYAYVCANVCVMYVYVYVYVLGNLCVLI